MNRQHTERLGARLRVYCILSVISGCRVLRPLTEFGLHDGLQSAAPREIEFRGGVDDDQV